MNAYKNWLKWSLLKDSSNNFWIYRYCRDCKRSFKGEGLGNKFLANIREVDAIVHVVRAFDDENVMREQGREDAFVDPLADIGYH